MRTVPRTRRSLSALLLGLGACASPSIFERTPPADDLRAGDRVVFRHAKGPGIESAVVAIDADLPVVIGGSGTGLRVSRELFDANGEWVQPAWTHEEASLYDVDASGRYEYRFGIHGFDWVSDVTIDVRAANAEDLARAEARREQRAEGAESVRRQLEHDRAQQEVAARVSAAERALVERSMRQCACNGTGYEIVGLQQRYERGVPVTYEVAAVREVHRHFEGHLRTFLEAAPCPACGGANRVADPPPVMLASEL